MSEDKTTVTFQLEQDKKDRWDEWLENEQSQYDNNLSQFIRLAVEKLIHETKYPRPSAGTGEIDMSQIRDVITQFNSQIQNVESKIDGIETSNRSNYVIDQLQQDIYSSLPVVDMTKIDTENARANPEDYGTSHVELCREFSISEYLVKTTLEELHQSTGRIVQVDDYYWRDE